MILYIDRIMNLWSYHDYHGTIISLVERKETEP